MDYVNLKKNFRNLALIIKALDSHLSLLLCKVEWFVIGYMGINKGVKFFRLSEVAFLIIKFHDYCKDIWYYEGQPIEAGHIQNLNQSENQPKNSLIYSQVS